MPTVAHRDSRLQDHERDLNLFETEASIPRIEHFNVSSDSPVPFKMSAKAINVVAWACV